MPSDRERIKQLEEQMRDVEDRHAAWLEGYTTLANRVHELANGVNELRKGELYVNSMIAAICLILGEKDTAFAEELRAKAKAIMDAAANPS